MVEREAYAVRVLAQAMEAGAMAPCPVWSDARTFRGRPWRGLVDGVFGGIPCQPHSLAGRRAGIEDERDLFGPFRRIVVQSGAWWCLIENVPGMLAAPTNPGPQGRTIANVIGGHFRVRSGEFRTGKGTGRTVDLPGENRRALAAQLMGMPWATMNGMSEAVPPSYTREVGRQLLHHIERGMGQ